MPLTDVWRNVGREIGIYWKGHFDQVPDAPGVYAWFLPLRLTSYDLDAFVDQVQRILNYDAAVPGSPASTVEAQFSWSSWSVRLSRNSRHLDLTSAMRDTWRSVIANPQRFEEVRRSLMKASILMPPLYVGKTDNLRVRCRQHLEGSGKNDFHQRYESYAQRLNLVARQVTDLIFASIRTEEIACEEGGAGINEVLEAVMKALCSPPYSAR